MQYNIARPVARARRGAVRGPPRDYIIHAICCSYHSISFILFIMLFESGARAWLAPLNLEPPWGPEAAPVPQARAPLAPLESTRGQSRLGAKIVL